MFKKVSIFIALIILFLLVSTTKVLADKVEETSGVPEAVTSKQLDIKAKILADYLATHNSPLQYHAQDFIDASKEFDLDWRLVAAISGVESTFGKFIPGGYNGWGWGVYGNQAIYFNSWKEGIYTVSKGLRESYINKGYTEPYSMNRIYAASPVWGSKVSYFMAEIEEFAKNYPTDEKQLDINPTSISAHSGQLASSQ